jgi:chemotaxis protein MotD
VPASSKEPDIDLLCSDGETTPASNLADARAAVIAAGNAGSGNENARDKGAAQRDPRMSTDALLAQDPVPAAPAPAIGADASANAGQAQGVIRQIVERLNAEVVTVAPDGHVASRTLGQPLGSPAKIIYIQLQPADLGTVTIRMSVKDQALQLDLEVGRGETAHMIQRERDNLSAMLRSAGYLIDGVDVRLAAPSAAHPPTGNGQPNANQQMLGGGQSRGGSQQEGRSQGSGQQQDPRGVNFGNERAREDDRPGRTAGNGGLYV